MRKANYPLYDTDAVNNLKQLVVNCAAKYPHRLAFEYRGGDNQIRRITYSRFQRDIECLGTSLYALGAKDWHIAVLGENSYAWITAYLSVTGGSNVIVPIDPELPPLEMKNVLVGSECRALFHSQRFALVAQDLARDIPELQLLINMDAPADQEGIISFLRLLEKGEGLLQAGEQTFIDNLVDDHALAAIIYTSGTTGASKGVMLSQYNMASNVVAASRNAKGYESSLLVLPLHHTFGWTAGVLCMLQIGSKICINSSLKTLAKDIQVFKPTQMCLVPLYLENMYKRIWDTADKQGRAGLLRWLIKASNGLLKIGIDLRRSLFKEVLASFGGELRLIICGGAPLNPRYSRGFRELGILVLNGYGLTECSPIVTGNRNEYYRDDSIGLALPGCQVKIDSPAPSLEGELLVQGPNVMLGYYHNPEATSAAMDGDWLKSGDVGIMDSDGFIYLTGRLKNMIKLSNGLNIYPEELEMLLADIPYIKEVAVYGETRGSRQDPELIAEIFLDQDYLAQQGITDPEDLISKDIEAVNHILPYYKKIHRTKIRPTEFEKTTTRKIKRFTIHH